MKKVILRAPVLTQSGYGVHARQVARWLLGRHDIDLSINAMPWGDTPWHIDSAAQNGLIGELMTRTCEPASIRGQGGVSFQLQLPNEWDPTLADVNVGMTAGVETDRCNPEWITACNKMSCVVVPSKHVETCLRATGTITVPVHVVPEAWSAACAVPAAELPSGPVLDDEINLLVFGQLTGTNPYNDRKNTFFAIRWLCELFADDPRVGIVLKTNACRNTLIDRDIVVNALKGVISQVRAQGKGPRLHLIHGDMSDADVAALYRHPRMRALIAPTRGEGFGLPILEAAACGLPVVATAWSGHVDFLSDRYSSVQYQLEQVHSTRVDGRIFVKGARWASPNEQDFKRRVRDVVADPAQARQRAAALRDDIVKSHSPEAITAMYDVVLGGYLA